MLILERSTNTTWHDVCAMDDIIVGTGVAARLNGEQLAVFNTGSGVFAIGNFDPFSGANVLARGLLGDIAGVLVVASPVYKQHFCLKTGQCLEDPEISVPAYETRICDQSKRIQIRVDSV
ncbi:MAG: nitrite reductase small subunit NirD [Pseudohongiella sp.]|nr:nitrite reductase small subunit NirD [Pseudohongiella sp.]MDP2380488.1 nitrite reductase small subunit NirD [Pseudohongiella sp.]MDP3516216.1 nitrite reductase small subunit NirD [Pseudohongiella sp.]